MNSVEFSASTCRICLQQEATYSIFDDPKTDIQDRLNKYLMVEKLEDVEGYPRKICSNCKITLDKVCEFIDTYKHSCKVLSESLFIVKVDCISSDYDYLEKQVDNTFSDLYKTLVSISPTGKKNNNDASQILEKLKPLPGLNVTKVDTKKISKENVSKKNRITKKPSAERISKTNTKTKMKQESQKKENKLIQIKENIENRKKKMKEKILRLKQENVALCNYCGVIFDKKEKLICHIQSKHMDTKVTCTICYKQYPSEERLRQHKNRFHREKILKCEYCNKMFACKGVLNNHVKVVHKKHLQPKKLYNCQYCNKTYKARQALIVHERTLHTGIKPNVCSICDKTFANAPYLQLHMRLHTGERPFKCPICERGYSQLCNMKSHLRQHKKSELNDSIMPKMRPSLMKFLKDC